jgi:thioester reductase-like protein
VGRNSKALLVTGASGFVGAELVARLATARPESPIYCLVRAGDPEHLERRRRSILDYAGVEESDSNRVVALAGDGAHADRGLGSEYGRLAREIGEIYHAAAATRFDLPLDEAREINCRGTENVLGFAREAEGRSGLDRLHHLSTAFVAGDCYGLIAEDDQRERSFRNSYEQTKWEAECALDGARNELPITIYRPSIVAGDSSSGRTLHFRVLYQPMKWIYTGAMMLLPCRPEVRIDVVPVDFVCDAVLAIGGEVESIGGTYHLSAGPENSISIREIIDISVETGNAYHAEIGREPIEPPHVVSPDSIDEMNDEERERYGKIFEVAGEFMRTHLPYMLNEVLFDDRRSRRLLEKHSIRCPSLRDYLPVLVRYAGDRQFADF